MTASLQAISAEATFLARLRAEPFTATVHSVFDRVVNVRCSGDRLYTLACAHSDNAPATLVVDTPSFAGFDVRPGASVASEEDTLSVGPALAISLGHARPWSAALPPWPRADVPLDWLEQLIAAEGVCGGVMARARPRDDLEAETSRLLGDITTALGAALLADQREVAYAQGSRLVGLGPGLTPAGDDYLVGLTTVYAMGGDDAHAHRRLLAGVIEDNAHRTNEISYAAMAQATRGCVRESIVEFARALTRGDTTSTKRRARQVIAIGATSGTDILLGMQAGFRLNHVMRGR